MAATNQFSGVRAGRFAAFTDTELWTFWEAFVEYDDQWCMPQPEEAFYGLARDLDEDARRRGIDLVAELAKRNGLMLEDMSRSTFRKP